MLTLYNFKILSKLQISKLEITIYVIRNYEMHETFPNISDNFVCL